MAAEFATPQSIAFFLQHTSGVICATVTSDRARELALGPMVQQNTESQRTAFLVTVDYRHGTTTGISAADLVQAPNLTLDNGDVLEGSLDGRGSAAALPEPRPSMPPAAATGSACSAHDRAADLRPQQLEVNHHRVDGFFTSCAMPAVSRPSATSLRE